MTSKTALITGITGQDGAYLAELCFQRTISSTEFKRRSSSFNTERVDHLYTDPHEHDTSSFYTTVTLLMPPISFALFRRSVRPRSYNLAAQSHVQVSFETPEYTANADGLGTLRLLEALRILELGGIETKFLSGFDIGTLRPSASSAAGNDTFPSPIALCGCQAVRLLDNGELPRGLWLPCV